MATKKNPDVEQKTPKASKAPAEDLVEIMIPYIEGEDPYRTIGINGKYTQVKRGARVKVSRDVAEVIQNSDMQMIAAIETQKKFEDQEFDWE